MSKLYTYQPAGDIIVTTTGNIDDLDIQGCSLLVMNNASSAVIRGIKAGFPGQILTILAINAAVTLAHQNAGSIAANRLINSISDTIRMQWTARYQYDSNVSRWRQLTETNGWQNIPFNAGDFTGSVGTWTVTAPNVTTCRYKISLDNEMTLNFFVQNTNVGTSGGTLDFLIPGGRISATTCAQPIFCYNATAGPQALGFALMAAGSNKVNFFSTEAGGTFNATAGNNTTIIAFLAFEVQP